MENKNNQIRPYNVSLVDLVISSGEMFSGCETHAYDLEDSDFANKGGKNTLLLTSRVSDSANKYVSAILVGNLPGVGRYAFDLKTNEPLLEVPDIIKYS